MPILSAPSVAHDDYCFDAITNSVSELKCYVPRKVAVRASFMRIAIGACIYQCKGGQRPFPAMDRDTLRMAVAHTTDSDMWHIYCTLTARTDNLLIHNGAGEGNRTLVKVHHFSDTDNHL